MYSISFKSAAILGVHVLATVYLYRLRALGGAKIAESDLLVFWVPSGMALLAYYIVWRKSTFQIKAMGRRLQAGLISLMLTIAGLVVALAVALNRYGS